MGCKNKKIYYWRERETKRKRDGREEREIFFFFFFYFILFDCVVYIILLSCIYVKIKTEMLGVYNIINQMFKFQNFVIKLMHKK